LARLDFVENSAIEILSLSEVLRDLVEEFEVIAQGSAIVLKYQIAEHVRIQGEKHKIIEMISNLVSNAMKYIDNDRIVSIVLEIKNNMAVLVVQDTGVGIAAVDIPYIFDRFYRGNEMSASGTGLGLAICKKIILLHRGTIRVESAVGVGTRMEVRLPLAVK
jgi:signal transduction histidine kinase